MSVASPGLIKPPDHFSNYSSTLPMRQQEAVHADQAAAFDKAVHGSSTHSVENHASSSDHGGHCCCCCCCGGGGSMRDDGVETAELLHAAKKLNHAIKDARKEQEYWDAFNKSVYNSIFQRGNRIVENAKKEGERILEEYYLNPPKSNKRQS